MINGVHAILYNYNNDADATRVTLARVLGARSVDSGGGWLIFALPPAEIAVHPAERGGRVERDLLDDVAAAVTAFPADQRPGLEAADGLALPGGVELGLYQPRHPTAAQPS